MFQIFSPSACNEIAMIIRKFISKPCPSCLAFACAIEGVSAYDYTGNWATLYLFPITMPYI